MQRSGETPGTASIQAAGSPTGHTDALPYHLLHQSSGTSAASGMTEHQNGLRHVNTRKRVTCFTAASPRQALDQRLVVFRNVSLACNTDLPNYLLLLLPALTESSCYTPFLVCWALPLMCLSCMHFNTHQQT